MSNRGIVRLKEDEPVGEPWANVPPEKNADMESCVNDVMAKDSTLDKSAATAICYKSVVEGQDLDEVMRTFKLDHAPAATAEPVAEAATIKARVRAAIRALDELLTEKEIPEDIRSGVKSLRETFRKTWADLATDANSGSTRQSEAEPQAATNKQNEPVSPGGGDRLTHQAALKIVADYFG